MTDPIPTVLAPFVVTVPPPDAGGVLVGFPAPLVAVALFLLPEPEPGSAPPGAPVALGCLGALPVALFFVGLPPVACGLCDAGPCFGLCVASSGCLDRVAVAAFTPAWVALGSWPPVATWRGRNSLWPTTPFSARGAYWPFALWS